MKPRLIAILIVTAVLLAYTVMKFMPSGVDPQLTSTSSTKAGAILANVKVPDLTSHAELGKVAYDTNCAACHGANAGGNDGVAPPLVHKIYEPSHHSDAAFLLAAKNGVRAHHWRFGNMPPIKDIDDQDVAYITQYVRELQRANGIQ
jgi:mono/diheme cytochrome c family protein